MVMDLEWYAEHTERLNELDRKRVIAEMEAKKRRDLERKMTKVAFMDNKEKVSTIKKWYPMAFKTITECFPGFSDSPEDYPPAIVSAVNNVISLQCGLDYYELQLK